MSEGLRITAAEALRALAEDAARDLSDLSDTDKYNEKGNHDAQHRRRDLETGRAVRAVAKAETVLRMVAGLIAESEQAVP